MNILEHLLGLLENDQVYQNASGPNILSLCTNITRLEGGLYEAYHWTIEAYRTNIDIFRTIIRHENISDDFNIRTDITSSGDFVVISDYDDRRQLATMLEDSFGIELNDVWFP